MSQQSFSQLGARLRAKTARTMFNGVQPSRSANSLALLQRSFAGGRATSISHSDNNSTFRCQINYCGESGVVCGE